MRLIDFINTNNQLSDTEKELIVNNVETRTMANKEYFVKSGTRSSEIGFITSGIFRYFFYDGDGNEVTSHFMAEDELVGSITSFFEFTPSAGSIQAVTDCELIIINRNIWDLFCREIPQWETTIQKKINEVILRKANFQRSLINSDAKNAYLNFMHTFPSLAQRVPLNHIASYLGITPFSLSRIRKAIASL